MLKLVLQNFVTLDGVYQSPAFPDEDTEGGFKLGGWQPPMWDSDAKGIMDQQLAETKALLLGRKTYEIFAAYWPTAKDDPDVTRLFNSIPKYLASRTLKEATWKGTVIMGPNLAQEIARARQQADSGIIFMPGSGNLAQSLMRENLIDEYRLWLHPVLLGSGKRLFAHALVPINFKLADHVTTASGVTILTYRPEGK